MEQCANTAALNRYMEQQEREESEYEQLLNMLRDSEPGEYEDIIDSFGYGSTDLVDIIKDI